MFRKVTQRISQRASKTLSFSALLCVIQKKNPPGKTRGTFRFKDSCSISKAEQPITFNSFTYTVSLIHVIVQKAVIRLNIRAVIPIINTKATDAVFGAISAVFNFYPLALVGRLIGHFIY